MSVLKERALIIFEEDVRNVELLKKLRARITVQMLPSHRYDGILTVGDSLRFEGKELLTEEKFRFDINLSSVIDLHLGFDETFVGKDSKGEKYQLNPVRIKYRNNDNDDNDVVTLYAFIEYNGPFRSNSGEECYRVLKRTVNIQ